MADLFINQYEVVRVNFDNDVVVTIKKFIDAGLQEDLEAEMGRVRMDVDEDSGEDGHFAYLNVRNIRLVQKMIISIRMPDGTLLEDIPMSLVKSMSREGFMLIMNTVHENNPPLVQIRQKLAQEKAESEKDLVQKVVEESTNSMTDG